MPPRRTRLVTLTTDLGPVYSAQMKGVLCGYLPPSRIVDLDHELTPHGVREAAFLLLAMGRTFPPGTVHIAVVDPGVGGARVPLAIECHDGSLLVGPDNGILVPLAEALGLARAYRLDLTKIRGGSPASATFEGRDVFAPAAGMLATGHRIERLGSDHRPFRLPPWRVERVPNGIAAEVLHIDRFGDVITSAPSSAAGEPPREVEARFGRRRSLRLPVVRTYEDLAPGALGVLVSSFGTLEVSARERRASDLVGARVGDPVVIRPRSVADLGKRP
jgi:S-adenosyl-L-methionine hydrolase (adenosine-forming)